MAKGGGDDDRVMYESVSESNIASGAAAPLALQEQINSKPFERTIEALKEIPEINSPMQKLEYIY